MPIEKWSEQVNVVRLADDPQFTDDLEQLQDQLAKASASTVLDFSGVRFINSSNISRLLRLRQQTISTDLKLILCGIKTPLWGTFMSTGLDKVFEFSADVTNALTTLQIAGK